MFVRFLCPSCRTTLRVAEDSVGQLVRCGGCDKPLRVPENPVPPADSHARADAFQTDNDAPLDFDVATDPEDALDAGNSDRLQPLVITPRDAYALNVSDDADFGPPAIQPPGVWQRLRRVSPLMLVLVLAASGFAFQDDLTALASNLNSRLVETFGFEASKAENKEPVTTEASPAPQSTNAAMDWTPTSHVSDATTTDTPARPATDQSMSDQTPDGATEDQGERL